MECLAFHIPGDCCPPMCDWWQHPASCQKTLDVGRVTLAAHNTVQGLSSCICGIFGDDARRAPALSITWSNCLYSVMCVELRNHDTPRMLGVGARVR